MKARSQTSTHKKVVVLLHDRSSHRGYLNPAGLADAEHVDLLTESGERAVHALERIRCIYFVREFNGSFEPERKAFFSRPKLDGLWVRLRFRDGDTIEGIVPNNLVEILENGIQVTPPDLNGNSLRLFIPRASLSEMVVLGVVGGARRVPREAKPAVATQPKLFSE
jgi:hypothetical protein